jgi:hypothetical protein
MNDSAEEGCLVPQQPALEAGQEAWRSIRLEHRQQRVIPKGSRDRRFGCRGFDKGHHAGGIRVEFLDQPLAIGAAKSRKSASDTPDSLALTGRLVTDQGRGISVKLDIQGGPGLIDESRTHGRAGFLYESGNLSVSGTYFFASINHKMLSPDGEPHDRTSPCYFALPVDRIFVAFKGAYEQSQGRGSKEAEFDEFIEDIANALRLYARQWLDAAIVDGKTNVAPKVFGFHACSDSNPNEKLRSKEYNKRAAAVLMTIEQGEK